MSDNSNRSTIFGKALFREVSIDSRSKIDKKKPRFTTPSGFSSRCVLVRAVRFPLSSGRSYNSCRTAEKSLFTTFVKFVNPAGAGCTPPAGFTIFVTVARRTFFSTLAGRGRRFVFAGTKERESFGPRSASREARGAHARAKSLT